MLLNLTHWTGKTIVDTLGSMLVHFYFHPSVIVELTGSKRFNKGPRPDVKQCGFSLSKFHLVSGSELEKLQISYQVCGSHVTYGGKNSRVTLKK